MLRIRGRVVGLLLALNQRSKSDVYCINLIVDVALNGISCYLR